MKQYIIAVKVPYSKIQIYTFEKQKERSHFIRETTKKGLPFEYATAEIK